MNPESSVPEPRVRAAGTAPVNPDGEYVLYWMIANRRLGWNFSIERARDWCVDLGKPLLILEALRSDYPWASDRLHRFVLDGMVDNRRRSEAHGVCYYPYVEPRVGAGRGLLEALAARACVVVTEEYPAFFLPRMVRAAADKLPARLETVDSNGLLPLRAAAKAYPTAYSFRRFLQKELPAHIDRLPEPDPLASLDTPRLQTPPSEVLERWPAASAELLAEGKLARLPIDHSVEAVTRRGGPEAAERTFRSFLERRLPAYGEERNRPQGNATSRLSPYLHFGHVGTHQVFAELARQQGWSRERLGDNPDGKRAGWWGMSTDAEAFLDQLVTWRELGFNTCFARPDFDQYESLPDWAIGTLGQHAGDERPHLYSLSELESASTHDPLWNAAQTQLVREGVIHNYLRMLWGKKILEWSESPMLALEHMIELNNKYAVDGRDPNSYSGIFWVLGRYDRPFGPERPVFGKVRYMSSKNTARKFPIDRYIATHDPMRDARAVSSTGNEKEA